MIAIGSEQQQQQKQQRTRYDVPYTCNPSNSKARVGHSVLNLSHHGPEWVPCIMACTTARPCLKNKQANNI